MKKLENVFGIVFFIMMLFPHPGFTQEPIEEWVKRYDGGHAHGLAVDASGNVYVTGESNYDYVTVKYDALVKTRHSLTY